MARLFPSIAVVLVERSCVAYCALNLFWLAVGILGPFGTLSTVPRRLLGVAIQRPLLGRFRRRSRVAYWALLDSASCTQTPLHSSQNVPHAITCAFSPNTLRSIIKMQTLVENFLAFIFPHNCITSAATFRQLKMGEQSFHIVKQESLSQVSRFSLTHKNDLTTISPKYPQMPQSASPSGSLAHSSASLALLSTT